MRQTGGTDRAQRARSVYMSYKSIRDLTSTSNFGKIDLNLDRGGLVSVPRGTQLANGKSTRITPLFRVDFTTRSIMLKMQDGKEYRIGELVALKLDDELPVMVLSLHLPINDEVRIF